MNKPYSKATDTDYIMANSRIADVARSVAYFTWRYEQLDTPQTDNHNQLAMIAVELASATPGNLKTRDAWKNRLQYVYAVVMNDDPYGDRQLTDDIADQIIDSALRDVEHWQPQDVLAPTNARIAAIAREIQDYATEHAAEWYLSADSDHTANIVDEARGVQYASYARNRIIELGYSAGETYQIMLDLDDHTHAEIRPAERGTGNFNDRRVIFWQYLGEITESPEWSNIIIDHDPDSKEWKAAVATCQAYQLSLGDAQQYGIAEDGDLHYDFSAYACLVMDKAATDED